MILHIHSDASYLSDPKACSRVGGHFLLSSNSDDPSKQPTTPAPNNGALHTVSVILKNVMSSATEADLAGLFHNAKYAAPMRVALEDMGRKQPATPIQTDNYCATGISHCRLTHHQVVS